MQANDGVYPLLLAAHATQFNWAYSDGYPDLEFVQQAFALPVAGSPETVPGGHRLFSRGSTST